jgi:hypothetical protein
MGYEKDIVRVPKCIHHVKEKRLITQLFDTKLPL